MNLSSQNHHGIKNLSYPINLYSVLDINDYFQWWKISNPNPANPNNSNNNPEAATGSVL